MGFDLVGMGRFWVAIVGHWVESCGVDLSFTVGGGFVGC